jgi:hypothetical protein
MCLEQRAAICFLTFKGLRASAIAAALKSVDETEEFAISPVKKWRKHITEGRTSLYHDPSYGESLTNDLSEAISSILKERSYLSCKVLCRHFRFAKRTCLRILHDILGVKKSHLRWVLHDLDTNQKAERVNLSHGILSVLQSIRSTGFQSVITGDESWSFLYYPRDSIWASARGEMPERVSPKSDGDYIFHWDGTFGP